MAQYRPEVGDVLATVREFLEQAAPALAGETRYHAQVAAYLLGICERELQQGPEQAAAERARLAAFLQTDAPVESLNRMLAAGIRGGVFDQRSEALLRLLLEQSAGQVAVVRPDHLAPLHRKE